MSKFTRISLLAFVVLLAMAPLGAAKQVPEEKAQPVEAQLKERVTLFYKDLLKNDRLSALELVSPESKNQFLNNKYSGLTDFRITGVEIGQDGQKATVHVVRVTRVAHAGQLMDLDINDTWQRSNDQWFLVLPPPGELNTPFGKMKVGMETQENNPEAEAMKQKIQEKYNNVDPDQYLRALQKVLVNSDVPATKPTDKQAAQPTPPTPTQDTKPKPQP